MITFDKVRSIATSLPGVEEARSYGTPAFKVRNKLMARLKEDSETLVIRVTWEERERLLATCPEVFFLTEHYRTHPWVLMRLSVATAAQTKASLVHAWHLSAPTAWKRSIGAK